MKDLHSLAHVKWECKYHIVWVPKYRRVGFLKGKSAIRLHREFVGRGTTGKHFWVRGYYVSTVGYDEKEIREYIRNQEKLDKEQMELELE